MRPVRARRPAWPDALFLPGAAASLVADDGTVEPLPVDRWSGDVRGADRAVLDCAAGATLDVGCGPGRHVAALTHAGRPALGIDVSASAIREARRRGAPAVRISVFGPVPFAGRWGTVLLLDGNVGIGGHPPRLLSRCRSLLRPGGIVVAEANPPGVPSGLRRVRVHQRGVAPGAWFNWAPLGPADLEKAASATGFFLEQAWESDGRSFQVMRADSRWVA